MADRWQKNSGRFIELNNNLTKILDTITNNNKLCKLLYYETDPLAQSDLNDNTTLLYNNIFPYDQIPTTTESAMTFLNVYFDRYSLKNYVKFKEGYLIFEIIININNLRIPNGLRKYYIMNEIDNMFNEANGYGVGKILFQEGHRFDTGNPKFIGERLVYNITDFN